LLYLGDVFGLKTLGAFHYLELHFLSFIKGAIPITLDGTKVDENILASFLTAGNEAEPLGIVEPLYSAGYTITHPSFPRSVAYNFLLFCFPGQARWLR
jgi:hypothetical protein